MFAKSVIYKIAVYVPEKNLEAVKEAMFAAGAGRIGNYDACAWQVSGMGQFRPLKGSNPVFGKQNKLEKIAEYRVEMICPKQYIKKVVDALKQAHPYEEPAYDVWRLGI